MPKVLGMQVVPKVLKELPAYFPQPYLHCEERLCSPTLRLDYSVIPAYIYQKVKSIRRQFSASIARPVVKNEIIDITEQLKEVRGCHGRGWTSICECLIFILTSCV